MIWHKIYHYRFTKCPQTKWWQETDTLIKPRKCEQQSSWIASLIQISSFSDTSHGVYRTQRPQTMSRCPQYYFNRLERTTKISSFHTNLEFALRGRYVLAIISLIQHISSATQSHTKQSTEIDLDNTTQDYTQLSHIKCCTRQHMNTCRYLATICTDTHTDSYLKQ